MRLLVMSLALTGSLATAHAQQTVKPFAVKAYAIDAQTLAGGGMVINLWGVQPATGPNTLENNRARLAIDDLMGEDAVKCTPMIMPQGGAPLRAQCLNGQERDISLMLIQSGFVSVNRRDVMGSALAPAYITAERKARIAQAGIWGSGSAASTAPSMAAQSGNNMGIPGDVPLWVVAGALLLVPLIGFLIVGWIMHAGFRQLISLQKHQLAGTQKRERQLKEREKYVIASALEGEINTNRAKLDAFLVIYEELLKSLRDPSKKPKYQRAGDIIHEKPALSRTVYDAHIDKIVLLGPQIASELSSLYAMIDPSPDYRTLEPEVPIEKARDTVDRILRNATKIADPMDRAIAALGIIMRDKRGITA